MISPDSRTLPEFIAKFSKYAAPPGLLKCYRGQRIYDRDDNAGIFRREHSRLLKNEKKAVRQLISVRPSEFAPDVTMFDRLVRMQHFGLPTRLMDVTLNVLVALYFATKPDPKGKETDGAVTAFAIPDELDKFYDSDTVSCLANLANLTDDEKQNIVRDCTSLTERDIAKFNNYGAVKKLLVFIRAEKPYFENRIVPPDLFKAYYVHPKLSNARILAQSGAFITYGLGDPAKSSAQIKRNKFRVPKDCKKEIRNELARIGINESTLFPEIDKAATRIKNYYTDP